MISISWFGFGLAAGRRDEESVEVSVEVERVEHVYVAVLHGVCLVLTLAFHVVFSAADAKAQAGAELVPGSLQLVHSSNSM